MTVTNNPLLADLLAAFPPTPISAAGAFQQRGITYPEASAYTAALDLKCWDVLDAPFFARRSDALYFLGDVHVARILPLYLHLLVILPPTSPVPEALLSLLTRPEPADEPTKLFGWQQRRFEGLTSQLNEEQKRMVARSLLQFAEASPHDPALATALERYWRAFA